MGGLENISASHLRSKQVRADSTRMLLITTSHPAELGLHFTVERQAYMLSFVESLWVMGILFLIMLLFVLLLRNPRQKTKAQAMCSPAIRLMRVTQGSDEEELLSIH